MAVTVYRTRSAIPRGRTTITARQALHRKRLCMTSDILGATPIAGGPNAVRVRSPWPTTTKATPKGALASPQHGHLEGLAAPTVGIAMIQDLTSSPESTICVLPRFINWAEHDGRTALQGKPSRYLFEGRRSARAPLLSRRLVYLGSPKPPNMAMHITQRSGRTPSANALNSRCPTISRLAQEQNVGA